MPTDATAASPSACSPTATGERLPRRRSFRHCSGLRSLSLHSGSPGSSSKQPCTETIQSRHHNNKHGLAHLPRPDASSEGLRRCVRSRWPMWLTPSCVSMPSLVTFFRHFMTPALFTSAWHLSSWALKEATNCRTDSALPRSHFLDIHQPPSDQIA